MRHLTILISLFLVLVLQSCQPSLTDFATNWTNDIKQKIIEDANHHSDKMFYDSASNDITLYKGDIKLKFFHLTSTFDSVRNKSSLDTALSIFYSKDQNFELVRELCLVNSRSFEGIRYKGNHLGLALFVYCNGQIKEEGLRYNNLPVGVWTSFDERGNKIKEVDNGNTEKLTNLYKIKYYR